MRLCILAAILCVAETRHTMLSTCCQYSLASSGGAYPLKQIVEGKLPQVCSNCSRAFFNTSIPAVIITSQTEPNQRRRHGSGRTKPRSVFVPSGHAGKSDLMGYEENADAQDEDEEDYSAAVHNLTEDRQYDRQGRSRRSRSAHYYASLREALRPLLKADLAADGPTLQATILSQVPLDSMPLPQSDKASLNSLTPTLVRLSSWFRGRIRVDGNSHDFVDIQGLTSYREDDTPSNESLAVAFTALVRASGLRCRIVCDISVMFSSHVASGGDGDSLFKWWTEVWDEEHHIWIPCDPLHSRVKDSSSATFPHGERGLLVDVTRRYVRRWEDVEAQRPSDWDSLLAEALKDSSRRDVPLTGIDAALEAERKTFRELDAQEELPRSASALQRHPVFVISTSLKRRQVLRQGSKPVATMVVDGKAQGVYLRECIDELRTRTEWRRHLRVVKEGEKPYRKLSTSAAKLGRLSLDKVQRVLHKDMCQLFGEWQTDEMHIGRAEGGKVPINDQGHVELLTPHHLPPGCAHIDHAAAALVARSLKIDFAPAMVGWVVKGGIERPLFQGVVVCAEYEDQVRQACCNRDAKKQAGSTEAVAGMHSVERTLASFRRVVLQVLARFKSNGPDTQNAQNVTQVNNKQATTTHKITHQVFGQGALDEGAGRACAVLLELKQQLLALLDREAAAAQVDSEKSSVRVGDVDRNVSTEGLGEQIRAVMMVVRALAAAPNLASGAVSALALAVNRLRLVLDE